MADVFPNELKLFISQYIESLAQMESLFLIRQNPQRSWDAAQIAKALYISPEMSASMLDELHRSGFLARDPSADPCYRYQPSDPEADRLLSELSDYYQARRVAVITEIYSKPVNKVQTFADAFLLRKDD